MFHNQKLKNIVKSKHFKSSFGIISIIASIIFFISCTVIFFQFLTSFNQSVETYSNRLANSVNETVNTAKNNAVFIGSMKSTDRLLNLQNPGNDDFYSMISDLSPFFNSYYYESVCMFFEKSHKIYVSGVGMYNWDDYFNQRFLESLENIKKDEWWSVDLDYSMYYGEQYPLSVLTYVRRLPIYTSDKIGYVSINIPISYLRKIAASTRGETPYNAIVLFRDKLIYSSDDGFYDKYDTQLSQTENVNSYFSGKHFIASTSQTDVSAVYFVDNKDILQLIYKKIPLYISSYICLLIAIFLCSFIYSYIMLAPIDSIMKKIGQTPYTQTSYKKANEFDMLGATFTNLNDQITNIENIMQKNRPLIKERLILEIVCNHIEIKENISEYEEYEIDFPHPYFSVVLIGLPETNEVYNYTVKEQLKLIIRQNATDLLGTLGKIYSAYVEDNGIVFLINTEFYDNLKDRINQICQGIATNLYDNLDISPLFSVGMCSRTNPIPYRAYMQAKRNIMFAYYGNDEFIPFCNQNEYTPSVDLRLTDQFVQCIIDKNCIQLKKLTSIYKKIYLTKDSDIQQIKKIASIFICSVFTKLLEVDIDVSEVKTAEYMKKTADIITTDDCERLLYSYFAGIINLGGKIPEESHIYIKQAMEYIEINYMKNISIPDIANSISINPIYLNKLFKLSTGKTISEYLNFHRIEVSKQMLLKSNDSINIISEHIGYNDTRSYIRFFKKFYTLTPSEYRKDNKDE